MTSPTPRQREVLRLLWGGATMREVGRAMDIASTNGVRDHCLSLERKGLVELVGKAAHARYELTDDGLSVLGLRRCKSCRGAGTVAA